MWPERQYVRSSAAERSRNTTSRPVKRSCFSPSLTERTPTTSAIPRRRGSRSISVCRDSASASASPSSSTSISSRSSTQVDRVDRRTIGSPFRSTYGQLCNPYLPRLTGNSPARNSIWPMGNSVATKVETTHVRRSAVAVRALPGARRSLRSLTARTHHADDGYPCGRPALPVDAPPEGDGRGERPQTVATRTVTPAIWSLLRRLPATLADDEQFTTTRVGLSARVIESVPRGARFPGRPSVRAWAVTA